jgi:hypothetical protein
VPERDTAFWRPARLRDDHPVPVKK